ncbi:MAG: DUF4124 domain-containing protein [Gammaproteobacteria bacterium]|nr:DUF4124 domain-containing protein [Gammaproteobacteria bacterium]
MRTLIIIGILASLALTSTLALTDSIYQSVGPDGSVIFSDHPSDGAKEIKLKPITTYNAKEASGYKHANTPATTTDPDTEDKEHYKEFSITSPANDAALPTGDAGNTTIQIRIDPPLSVKKGHRLSALVDGGQLDYVTSSSSISLRNLDRGTHSIRAVIVNKRGDIVQLSSNSITLHVQRASIFSPANNPP